MVQKYQYGTPVFIIPKKEETVRFIMYFRRLNHQLVRKPYHFLITSKTIQQLEGFHYATILDINMEYYVIRIDK